MKLRQYAKRIFTAALVVWMSGIVLVVCCQMPSADAAHSDMESCPLAKKGDCAKSFQENSGEFVADESQSLDCCIFPAQVFDKARKIEVQPSALVVAVVKIVAPPVFTVQKTFEQPKVYQSFIRNRGSIHLNNCVFRV